MEEASVAGESPDRSKQHESSAEPTPGSAGSVPETLDPRLTVSREKDSSGAAVDTATKVLSVRDVKEAAKSAKGEDEDADLREAVSAWVRSADDPEQPKPEADATAKKPAKPEASEPQTDSAADEPKKKAETEPEPEPAAEPEPKEKADAKAESKSEGNTDASAGTDAESKTGADTNADAKADADAVAKAPAEDETKTTDADKAEPTAADADESHAADADEPSAADGEDAAEDESRTGRTGGNKAEAESEAEAEAADGEDGPQSPVAGDETPARGNKAEGEGEAKGADGDKPSAAGGGKGIQGPPAPDDETRRGGAGGNKTDAKAKPPVDQPTTVIKAVTPKPPKAPQGKIDQPTTTLKAAGSKFVPLKNPDVTTAVPQIGPERTTQQPLPPKPPLDLLAELTNTPPPPETVVRTFVRRVKIWTPLVLLLAVVFAVVQTFRPLPSPALALTAKDSYTFGGDKLQLPWPAEGQGWIDGDGIGNMGNFGKQSPVAIGSVAKTMTSFIILRDHPLKPGEEGPKIKIDATAEKEGGYSKSGESTVNTLKAGQFVTEKQALSAVMIPSANNIARLLARWDMGSEAAFVKKMNDTAKELGMTNTTYTDPSGLKETTISTAEDQVKLGRLVVKNPALVAITSAASWTDPTGHNYPNWNKLPFQMGAIGIKTGSTTAAGGNLLFASRKTVGGQTVTIVGAILGQHKGTSILDTVNAVSRTALTAAQDALTSSKILKKGDVVGYVDDQLGGQTPIAITKDVTMPGWAGLKVKLSFASGTVPHTAKAGTKVGTLTVGDGSAGAVKVPVALQQDLAEPGFTDKLTRLG
ncbi:D-alanyl-D-alanine carboxypeptidase [Streptomyces griseochromogenes]|uniref:serine-type D-Ala-D-Ala carboxypeptidase n=1 Tax=Streptomyces griseochromogenes TaxID=68214 RepID=A0A1B1BED3_9ACTN|nr:D-alanyl-D-alanine carboxypeptidase [Streptomyces griseochromogenes]ANP57166.1 D-alanyl-D-alanine carboxypeptidase [Streptomyces griseochromogenes]MBP2052723.1 D-alanyl-D-alanine carboxypeptidase [Streptomyces griseochromogenes]